MSKATSIFAWHSVNGSGLVSASRLKVYNELYKAHSPMTRSELDFNMKGPNEVNPSYHKRLSELERMGIAETTGTRKCTITGKDCLVWQTTTRHVPIPFKKRQSKANKQNAALFELLDSIANKLLDDQNYNELHALQAKIDNIKRMKADS